MLPGDPDSDSVDDLTARGYDRLARDPPTHDRPASPWADSPSQRHYVWPAVRSLRAALSGRRVPDAGCGVGHYAEWVSRAGGATLTGVDAGREALAAARERCGDAVRFRRLDPTDGLAFADDGAFDLAFCNLVLDHVADWEPVLSESRRVPEPGGRLVVATIHPFRRYLDHREELDSYHETERYVVEWGDTDVEIPSYCRPMPSVVGSLVRAGLSITAFGEPTPTDAYRDHDPERYETASKPPDTLCIRARTQPE